MDLLFERMQVDERQRDQVLRVQQLDLSRFELSSLRRLQPFAQLAFLNASHNHLQALEEDVFFNLPCLTYLGTFNLYLLFIVIAPSRSLIARHHRFAAQRHRGQGSQAARRLLSHACPQGSLHQVMPAFN
jgi:hypothetical protein